MKKQKLNNKGITLVALVVTIVVLLILAGVSINLVVGDNGIITQARKAREETNSKVQEELANMSDLEVQLAITTDEYKDGVNVPNLKTGMTPINFKVGASGVYEAATATADNKDNNWYNYANKQWANAQTQDESMWVWIPRFAYSINDNKTFSIKFLIGTSDYYYDKDENGNQVVKKAARMEDGVSPDATKQVVVHPAFTNQVEQGGWDSELTGIWVAKFEAGFATSNSNATKKINKKSSVQYTQDLIWANKVETAADKSENDGITARNWLDGQYGSTKTNISYPIFQGTAYSMNYINHREAFALCTVLTEEGNPYGLSSDSDSHLMKNSEWGAVAYLAKSEYGLNTDDIAINNATLNSGISLEKGDKGEKAPTDSSNKYLGVYAITGVESGANDKSNAWNVYVESIEKLNSKEGRSALKLKIWSDTDAGYGSSSGTVYGVYDMSGGLWERMADYIPNGKNTVLGNTFEKNNETYTDKTKDKRTFTTDKNGVLQEKSTKYATVWPYVKDNDTEIDGQYTYDNLSVIHMTYGKSLKNIMYGGAVFETSSGKEPLWNGSWYNDCSCYPAYYSPFFVRGGSWANTSAAGVFAFHRVSGGANYLYGFRPVLA